MDECSCGTVGHPVTINLVRHQVRSPWRHDLDASAYSFCEQPHCPVIYFAGDGTEFRAEALRHPPAYKTGSRSDLLCYCFDVTGDDALGQPDPAPYIRARVRSGECACDVLNPSGACCLGSIGRWVRETGSPA